MPNIISNGSIFCLSTDSNEAQPIKIYNDGATTLTGVTLTVTLPAGLAFSSDTPSQGTFDDGTGVWDVDTLLTTQNSSNEETLDLCVEVTDDSLAPFEITWVVDCNECPDIDPGDNSGSRTIDGIICSEFQDCHEAFYSTLQEFDTMADAIAALGPGQPFLYTIDNLDGATYRGLHVTPLS